MTLNIGSSLSGGFRRFTNWNGLKLTSAYLAIGLVWQLLFYSAFVTLVDQQSTVSAAELELPSIGIPFSVAVGGSLLSLLALQYLTVIAIRTFTGGHSRSIPSEYYTRNILFVLGNTIVGGLVFGVIVFIGSLLFVVPGIIAYTAFIFVMFYLAVDDENFIAAFGDSWGLTRGHWLRLFGLLLILFVGISLIGGILSVLLSVIIGAIAGQALGTLVSGVIVLPFSLLTLAILAEAFVQLRNEQGSAAEQSATHH